MKCLTIVKYMPWKFNLLASFLSKPDPAKETPPQLKNNQEVSANQFGNKQKSHTITCDTLSV